MIRSVIRSWIAFVLVAAAGAVGTAAQVAGPIIGFGSDDSTGSLSAPASVDDKSGLRASPSALPDDGIPDVIVGPDNGSRLVRLLSGTDGSELASGYPFGPAFTGGVRVASGDLTGDGVADPIVAMGPGGGLVRLYSGADLTNVLSGYPFGTAFAGGVFVAAGDVSGDGRADVVVAQGQGGGEVRIYNAADSSLLASGFPFGPSYLGGVRVAAGDVNGDGRADVIAAQASGGLVSVINGVDQSLLVSGFPYGAGFSGGVFVAAGDVNADGHDDVIVAPGTGNGPIIVVDGRTSAVLGAFPAYAPGFSGGVRVAAGDLTGDGRADIITAPGGGGLPLLQVFDGATFSLVAQVLAYEPGFAGGLFVAAPSSSGRLRFTSASTATFTIGEAGTFSVTTAGMPPATSVTETGALPDGVTFTDNGDGTATLSGSPAADSSGTYSLTLTATNGVGPAVTQTFTLDVVDAAPQVTATMPADGATAAPVDSPLVVTFSEPVHVAPGAFSLECPPGTPVAVTVPTASPATQFTIDPDADLPATTACSLRIAADQVTDADGDDPPDTLDADVLVSFSTSACAAMTVSPAALVGGNVSVAYGPISFTQAGGAAPITWSVTSGTLPAGLALDASTGVLSGTPTASGAFPFTVTATAASGCTGAAPLTLTVASGPNQAPSFSVGPNQIQIAGEDSGGQTVAGWATAISPGPPDEAGQTVTFTITGNTNAALFSVAPAVSPTGTLTYTPAANANGTATMALLLQDNGGTALGGVDTSAPQSFTISVGAVNDAPAFTVGADQTVAENAGAQTVAGWATAMSAGPADEAAQTLTFAITDNSNPTLFSTGPAVSPAGALTYTTAPNASGTATVTLVLQDNGGTANGGADTSGPQSFTITLTGVNSAPSFNSGPNLVLAEDSGAQIVNPWAAAISPGPADEASQNLTFNVTGNTNPALFSAAPAVSPTTGALTYTPAANATGTATITLTLSDDGGTAGGGVDTSAPQTFTITVTDVNDAPSFVAGAGPTVAEDAGPQSIPTLATSISAGPPSEAGQTLTFVVTGNTNAALFGAGGAPAVSSTGTLTFTSAPNAFGTADITLVLQDNGGTAGGGVDTSAPPQTFTITVTPVNDAPSLTTPTIAYTTVGNTQLHVAGKILPGMTSTTDANGVLAKSGPSDIDGPATPAAVALSNVATPNGTITLDADGSFSYVPNAGFTGVDTFTVQVTDSVTPANLTVNVTVADRVWYVNNEIGPDNAAGGDGRSTNAFETLAAASTASGDNDILFVFNGDSATTPLTGGIALKNGQKLHGEGVGLTVGALSLVPVGTRPRIAAAGDAVSVLANTANGDRTGVEIRGFNLTSAAGNAVDATSANAANLGVRISENTIGGSGAEGIDITQNSTGTATLAVHDNAITALGTALDITRIAGAVVITAFDDNAISGNSGAGVILAGGVTFDATPGGALDPVNGGTTLIGQSGNGVSGAGLTVGSMTGALHFVDLDVFADAAALGVSGTGAFTGAVGTRITVTAGSSVLAAAAGPAVSLSNLTTDLQLSGMTSTNSGAGGVSLIGVGGTFTAPAGSTITNAADTAFNISGGNATVTYGGTITSDAATLVAVTGTTGGVKTFAGAITGGGTGIWLTGNTGAAITFSGGLTVSTSSTPAFNATGGGTVTVTDPAGPATNTIATTAGTTLNVTGTTIGAGGLVFQSIAASGGANGIVLNATGALGGLTVTGTGANDSGGVIQNMLGDAILLTNTRNVSLSQMRLVNAGQSHIDATNVTGLTLNGVDTDSSVEHGISGNGITNLTITGGTFHRGGANSEPGCNINGVNIINLLGTSSVTGATFTRSNTIQFRVSNTATSGSVDTLTVSGTNWNTHTGPCHGDHLSVDANNGSNFKLVTTAASGENNFQGAGIGVQATAGGTGTMQASVTGVQTSGNTAGVVVAATAASNISFNVFDNNTGNGTGFSSTGSLALALTCTTTGTCQGAFTNNSIAHTAGSGTNAMQVVVEGNGTGIVTIANNTINGNIQRGIHAQQGAGTGTGSLSLHVTGNNITGTDPGALQAVSVETSLSGDAGIVNTMCLNLANNTVSPNPFVGVQAYRLVSRATDVFRLQNFTGNGAVEADVQAWITTTKSNSGTPVAAATAATVPFTTVASCSTPTLPTP